ncbi:hypothetical protein D3C79_601920 [compost metagenome]
MQAERPALLDQVAHHRLQFFFHGLRQVRARLEEVLEVGGREHQHFARAIVAQEVGTAVQLDAGGPLLEVVQFFLGLLGEQVVGDAHGQLVVVGQLLDHRVVIGEILVATAGINGAGQAQAVELTHELASGVDLILQRQLRPLGQRGVEDHRVRAGDQHAGRVTELIALDLATWRVRGALVVADGLERSAVEQCAVIQVQQEYRGVRRGLVDFFQGGHAFFGELEFVPATDYPHPLRGWRARGLVLEHAQGISHRRHPFPAQFEVVVQATADQVQVRVIEARDHRALLEVDDLRGGALVGHGLGVAAHGDEAAVLDGDGGRGGLFAVNGVQFAVEQNQVGGHGTSLRGCVSGTGLAGKRQCGPERASGTEHSAGGEELATGLVVAILGHGLLRLGAGRGTAKHAG